MITHSKPTLGAEEAAAASDAVLSGWVAAGEATTRFESAVAARIGRAGAVATSSGTAALYVALKALGVKPGAEVIVPSFVCTALLHAVWAAGADPVVCDIGDDYNLSAKSTKQNITAKTAAIILPHLFGTPARADEFTRLGPPVIEDCAQAIGADVGSRGVVAIFSFYATKVITTGEGGMLAADSPEILAAARDLIDYDKKHDANRRFNLKFNDIGAHIGLVQLQRLDEFVSARRSLAELYSNALAGNEEIALPRAANSIYYRYVMETARAGELIAHLRNMDIHAERPVDPPLHRIVFRRECPNADRAYGRAVSLPIYPSLAHDEAVSVAAAVNDFFANRSNR